MAIVTDGPVLPLDLVTFVREVPQPELIRLNRFLPDRLVPYNRVDVGRITRTGRTAKFRAYDANVPPNKRDVATLTTVELPPLSDALTMGELERLRLEFARTQGTNQAAFVNAIYDDATALTQNMLRRMELARGDVLTDGKFTLSNEGGLTLEADYGVPPGNLVTAAVLWSDHANADPIADLRDWVYAYRVTAGNGFNPGGMIITYDILTDLLANQNIRNLAATLVGAPAILSRPQLDTVLAAHELPPIVEVYDSQFDVSGTATRATDDAKVIFVPPNPETNLGYTAWGVSATALELVNSTEVSMSFSEAPGIVGIVDKGETVPFRQQVIVDAVGMPVIENPYALFIATVR